MIKKTIVGSDVKLYVNNRLLGIVPSFSYSISTGVEPIRGIDDPMPQELAETIVTISGTMQVYRLRNDGGVEGRGLMALPAKVELEKYITMALVDIFTDKVIFQTNRARISSQQWQVASKQVISGTLSFLAIGYVNETG